MLSSILHPKLRHRKVQLRASLPGKVPSQQREILGGVVTPLTAAESVF